MGVDPLSLGLIQTRVWGGSGISHKQVISSEIGPQLKDNPWIPGEADAEGWGGPLQPVCPFLDLHTVNVAHLGVCREAL